MSGHYFEMGGEKTKNTFTLLIAFIIIGSFSNIFFSSETCKANGDTIYVNPGESIQEGINDADEGDTIYVYIGTYNENIIINKSIILVGEESETTTIQGNSDHTIKITVDDVTLSDFTIENTGSSSSYSSVFLNSITGCNIENNIIKEAGNGIYLINSNSNIISDNNLEDNNVGIYLSNADSNTIKNNNIQDNNVKGIHITSTSSNNTIYLNDFTDNIFPPPLYYAYDLGSNNWDYNSQGNYWKDYDDYDSNDDGIGDTAYDVPGGDNKDEYPLGYFLGNNEPTAKIASINPTSSNYGETIMFVGSGTDTDSGDYITAYSWRSSRDGQLSNSASFSTTGLSVGTHTIYFKVRDNHNEWSTEKTSQVTVSSNQNQKPSAYIVKPNNPTAIYGNIVEFQGYGTDDEIVVGYSWRSSIDGILSGERYFTKNDLTIGEHTIYFKVRDNDGQWSNEASTTITIEPDLNAENNPPTADANGPYLGNANESIYFDGSGSSDPDGGDSLTYNWYFGDGNNSEEMSPTHIYTSKGNYTVQLTVVDSHGEQNTDTTYANITKQSTDNGKSKNKKDKGIPGFELVFILIAIAVFLINKKINNKL